MGAGNSRNIGIIIQKENYIAFLDADDTWKNDKLDKQINFMKINNYDSVTHTSYSIINERKKLLEIGPPEIFSN